MTSISVVIPSFNDAEMLARCLTAIAAQTRKPDEVIVVDNGSTDATADVAEAAGAIVVNEPLRGTAPATAAGFDAATGDIIARLDADSVPPPDWVARVEAAFDARPELSVLTGPGDFYGSNPFVHWVASNVYIGGYFWAISRLLGHPPLFGSNLALRAGTWGRLRTRVHRLMHNVHDDFDMSFQIQPDMIVVFDPTLRVWISSRPFASGRSLAKRIAWAWTTLRVNFVEQSLLQRRAARAAWARDDAANRPRQAGDTR